MGRGFCKIHGTRLSLGHHFEEYCSECSTEERQRPYVKMDCKRTGKPEMQYVVRESEDGITLRCGGCRTHHSHEIGEFAHLYQGSTSLQNIGESPT